MREPLIEVEQLHYRYETGVEALRGVDFRLYPGETVALLGANGSGKTTFVLHLNGLLQGEGEIRVCGLRVEKQNLAAIRQKLGLVFQDPDEQLFMPTVLEDVCFGPLSHGVPPEEAISRARAALALTGMRDVEERAPYHLSAGEKRRVALAGVLAMRPEILVLDEPTTFLDPPAQKRLVEILTGLEQARIIVTHNLNLARRLATRAVFFEKGRIAGEGTVEELVKEFDWEW
jgi:cobalt/nickel transport system ATP-binding protein